MYSNLFVNTRYKRRTITFSCNIPANIFWIIFHAYFIFQHFLIYIVFRPLHESINTILRIFRKVFARRSILIRSTSQVSTLPIRAKGLPLGFIAIGRLVLGGRQVLGLHLLQHDISFEERFKGSLLFLGENESLIIALRGWLIRIPGCLLLS